MNESGPDLTPGNRDAACAPPRYGGLGAGGAADEGHIVGLAGRDRPELEADLRVWAHARAGEGVCASCLQGEGTGLEKS